MTCCHSNSSERPSANAVVKNSQWIIPNPGQKTRPYNNQQQKKKKKREFAKLSTLLSLLTTE